ncbi:hypothetical protein A2Y85_01700 [candidate division WOR-3 bacterium RBG_13_43_14]|uniref:Uncharacterized protein n=1 Tax=candidate division WOR-3 bacterium RBG_13_43_14 TaxID=1802590 RepID=A0A1F4U201_UNCW3|nr:MAG: hypothetical protein A2Y85_01700 [candidate division WOR-3 bacterium RBG_13_43_14]
MKKAWLLICVLLFAVLMVSCGGDEPEPPPTTGTVSGTIALQAGVSGDLNNTRVAIYSSYDDWANDRVLKYIAASGSGSSATFSITTVTPGTYYLDAWKDVDNSGTWNTDDLFGVYGTTQWPTPTLSPFSVAAGETFTANVTMIVLP